MHNDIYYLIKCFLVACENSAETSYYEVMIGDEFIENWSREYVKKQQALDPKKNAVIKWHAKTMDKDDCNLFFNDLQKNIIINKDLYEIKITGQEMNELFETMFESALKYLMKKRESFDSLTK